MYTPNMQSLTAVEMNDILIGLVCVNVEILKN